MFHYIFLLFYPDDKTQIALLWIDKRLIKLAFRIYKKKDWIVWVNPIRFWYLPHGSDENARM